MEEKVIEQLRFDFYGELLSARQKTIMDYYYNDDYALAEIGEVLGVTRQGVFDAYKRAKKQMCEYEEKLGLVGRFLKNRQLLDGITEEIARLEADERIEKHPELQSEIAKIRSDIVKIMEAY